MARDQRLGARAHRSRVRVRGLGSGVTVKGQVMGSGSQVGVRGQRSGQTLGSQVNSKTSGGQRPGVIGVCTLWVHCVIT